MSHRRSSTPASLRIYRGLLRALPPRFRRGFGDDMAALFHDRLAEARGSPIRCWGFWLRALGDLAWHGGAEWLRWAFASSNPGNLETMRSDISMSSLFQDLGYAIRSFRASPGFAALSIVTLGLGIGAATAMFSVVHAVLIQPLPFQDPDELVMVRGRWPVRGVTKAGLSPGDLADFIHDTTAFEDFAALTLGSAPVSDGEGDPEQVRIASVTPNFFNLLGLDTQIGRPLANGDPNGTALISHGLWQRRFGGDTGVLGRSVRIGNQVCPIVGVLPDGLAIPVPEQIGPPSADTEVWLAQSWDFDPSTANRNSYFLRVFARLKPNAGLVQAQQEADTVAADHRRLYADAARVNTQFDVPALHSQVVDQVDRPLTAFMVGVGFVLLIACANVANLQLVRAKARQGELAIRAALGAGRLRLLRQLLSEGLLLASMGALTGLALAFAALRVIIWLGAARLPRGENIEIDLTVLLFAAGLTGITLVLSSLLPAVQAARSSLAGGMGRAGGRAGSRRRIGRLLIVGEVALSLMLLWGAGLLARSFVALTQVRPGFQMESILTFRTNLTADRESDLARRIAGLPGVLTVGRGAVPLTGRAGHGPFIPDNVPLEDTGSYPACLFRSVTQGYFEVLGIPLRAGRLFEERDSQTLNAANPVLPAIVDQKLADRIWPGESALGRRLSRSVQGQLRTWEVVGVVGNVRQEGLRDEGPGTIYFAVPRAGTFVVRSTVRPQDLVDPIRAELSEVAPQSPLYRVRTVRSYVDDELAPARVNMWLGSLFAALALMLSAVGLYGVVSHSVGQRMQEMGIRMALGAGRPAITRLVVGQGLRLAAAGVLAGFAGAMALTRMLSALLFGVAPTDPATLAAIAALLLAVAACACYLPARRATRAEPSAVLRIGG